RYGLARLALTCPHHLVGAEALVYCPVSGFARRSAALAGWPLDYRNPVGAGLGNFGRTPAIHSQLRRSNRCDYSCHSRRFELGPHALLLRSDPLFRDHGHGWTAVAALSDETHRQGAILGFAVYAHSRRTADSVLVGNFSCASAAGGDFCFSPEAHGGSLEISRLFSPYGSSTPWDVRELTITLRITSEQPRLTTIRASNPMGMSMYSATSLPIASRPLPFDPSVPAMSKARPMQPITTRKNPRRKNPSR